MTKPKPKVTPIQEENQASPPSMGAAPPLDYCYRPDGSLVVILASGQKAHYEPDQIPPEFLDLPKPSNLVTE